MTKPLTLTQKQALLAAQQGGTTLYRSALDLEYGCVSASTLRALADRGLVELKFARVERRSHTGLAYKGMRTVLDHAVLTEAGQQARASLGGGQA